MAALCYDVVVVGAGPAGSSAARAAAQGGLSVLLVDGRPEIGRPVQCAEYVPRLTRADVTLPPSCVAQRTAALRTFLPDGSGHSMAAPGFVLYRERFDKHLAAEAIRAGADIALRARALRRTAAGLIVRLAGQEREVAAAVIVGADGVHSTVGRWIGQRNSEFVVAAQYEMVVDPWRNGAETEVYFSPDYPGGYAWVFPKGSTANVGVGVDARAGPSAGEALDVFVERLKQSGRVETRGTLAFTGGYVPVGGLLRGCSQNVLLAGDAVGCVHPLTGAGILYAIVSGRLAGQIAAEAVRAGDLTPLAAYESRLREAIGGPIERGLAQRRRLLSRWTDDSARLTTLLRETWIAFSGCETGRLNES